jgi:hypothetical protein
MKFNMVFGFRYSQDLVPGMMNKGREQVYESINKITLPKVWQNLVEVIKHKTVPSD